MDQSPLRDEYGELAEFYDWVVPYRERQDVAFFVDMAREARGPVLEIGCGTGRVLIPTAREGIEIVGLDGSESMLSVCRGKLGQEGPEVRDRVSLHQGDMRDFNLERKFPLVTLPFRPFQHLLTIDDQIACLTTIHRHLTKDGRLILDLFHPMLERLVGQQYVREFEAEPEATLPDGRKFIRKGRAMARDLANQLLDIELEHEITHPDGRKERRTQSLTIRYFFRFEVEHLLARCGFEVEHLYGDYDRSDFGTKYPGELLFVAKSRAL